MDLILEPLGTTIFIRALIASALVGIVCAVVGTYVVLRGIAFIGDAIAHAGFPGVVAAYMIGIPFYLGAAVAAVSTALAIGWVTKRAGIRQDTAIGVLFAGTFALGVFLFSTIDGYVADLFSFLLGNVLAIGPEDLVALVVLGGGVVLVGRAAVEGAAVRDVRPARCRRVRDPASTASSTCSSRSSR